MPSTPVHRAPWGTTVLPLLPYPGYHCPPLLSSHGYHCPPLLSSLVNNCLPSAVLPHVPPSSLCHPPPVTTVPLCHPPPVTTVLPLVSSPGYHLLPQKLKKKVRGIVCISPVSKFGPQIPHFRGADSGHTGLGRVHTSVRAGMASVLNARNPLSPEGAEAGAALCPRPPPPLLPGQEGGPVAC